MLGADGLVCLCHDRRTCMKHLKIGAYDYIVKPFTRKRLNRAVGEALGKRLAILEEKQHRRHLEDQVARQARELEGKVRELSALNRLFQADLSERFNMEEADHVDGQTSKEQRLRISISALQKSVKKRIAEHLHLQTKLRDLQRRLGDCLEVAFRNPENGAMLLEEINAEVRSVLDNDIRAASYELYPSIVKLGLATALRSLQARVQEICPTVVSLEIQITGGEDSESGFVPEEFKVGVYRIIEEALDNVVRHARAKNANVKLGYQEDGNISLAITDNGRGFQGSQGPYVFGLLTMKNYAEALGGRCQVGSAPGQGTRVQVLLPPPVHSPSPQGACVAA